MVSGSLKVLIEVIDGEGVVSPSLMSVANFNKLPIGTSTGYLTIRALPHLAL